MSINDLSIGQVIEAQAVIQKCEKMGIEVSSFEISPAQKLVIKVLHGKGTMALIKKGKAQQYGRRFMDGEKFLLYCAYVGSTRIEWTLPE